MGKTNSVKLFYGKKDFLLRGWGGYPLCGKNTLRSILRVRNREEEKNEKLRLLPLGAWPAIKLQSVCKKSAIGGGGRGVGLQP